MDELPIGVFSYGAATLAFAVLVSLLALSQRKARHGWLLIAAGLASMAWASVSAYFAVRDGGKILVEFLEILRDGAWLLLLWKIFELSAGENQAQGILRRAFRFGVSLFALVLGFTVLMHLGLLPLGEHAQISATITGRIMLAVMGLAAVEQLYRNANETQAWAIKHICLGLGGIFAFDFYLYADALLFKFVDSGIWSARGFVNALIVPLIMVSAARNPKWAPNIAISRRVAFHSATFFGAGVYLLGMAAAGYYIRLFGGNWGNVLQAAFLFGALVILLLLLFSGAMRARLKVLLNKHFFSYKYDYREEWLRFTDTLSAEAAHANLREQSLHALAELVDSPEAMLWVEREGAYHQVAHWNLSVINAVESTQSSLCSFLRERQWVINLKEYAEQPDVYGDLQLPDWLQEIPRAWLIVPLFLHEHLKGFMVLCDARSPREFNWEDSDLLKTAARQIAVYLAQNDAAEALIEARQFESFNRLSTYVVHDLKNIVAQLSLLLANAQKHKHNPEFQEDMLATVENAAQRMQRLLGQLRAGYQSAQQREAIDLRQLLERVVSEKKQCRPAPTLSLPQQGLWVFADKERLARVLGHLVQNAVEATPAEGMVQVVLQAGPELAVIHVQDNGKGMDERFIRDQLFRPFATTKSSGMGIGVYECREYVRELNGEMMVKSTEGQGTTFIVNLPLRKLVQTEVEPLNMQGASSG